MRFRMLCVSLALLLGITGNASAQVQSGNISGTVKDEQGGVLPGVRCHARRAPAPHTFTTRRTASIRFLNVPPGTYTLTAALTGLQTVIRDRHRRAVGQTVQPAVDDERGGVQETVTVTGESPVIDTKAMGTATNFTQDELARVPNSRDPWALLRTVPGVTLDRVNIAGNETGQQSAFVVEGRPSGRRRVDDGRRADHRHGHRRRVADLLRLRRVRRNPDLDGRQRHPPGRPAASG